MRLSNKTVHIQEGVNPSYFCLFSHPDLASNHVPKMGVKEFPGGLLVKDLALSLLGHTFNLWPGNFHMRQVQPKKMCIWGQGLVWIPGTS